MKYLPSNLILKRTWNSWLKSQTIICENCTLFDIFGALCLPEQNSLHTSFCFLRSHHDMMIKIKIDRFLWHPLTLKCISSSRKKEVLRFSPRWESCGLVKAFFSLGVQFQLLRVIDEGENGYVENVVMHFEFIFRRSCLLSQRILISKAKITTFIV